MFLYLTSRTFHTTCRLMSSVNKSLLAQLRKRTGYAFMNCRQALQMHNNDLEKAEQWLREQAQAHGWAKAMKLQGRTAKQGLIGICIKDHIAAMVEVNCETDFVARNDGFRSLVESIARNFAENTIDQPVFGEVKKGDVSQEDLVKISTSDGQSMSDILALTIGKLGENMVIRRGSYLVARPGSNVQFKSYSHPALNHQSKSLGKYGGVIAYQHNDPDAPLPDDLSIEEFAMQLCQHVVGMNPSSLGEVDDEPVSNSDDESRMLLQEFLLNSEVTVREALEGTGMKVLDFLRFECGEELDVNSEK